MNRWTPIRNCVWAMGFMEDSLHVGRRFRNLNILDEGVREGVHIEIDTLITDERAVRVMEQLKSVRELPAAIRSDNGPELTSQAFVDWCEAHGITTLYIKPARPNQNAIIERFNRTYRKGRVKQLSVRRLRPGPRAHALVAGQLQRAASL